MLNSRTLKQWPLVYWLIGANVVMFLLDAGAGVGIRQWLALWPAFAGDFVRLQGVTYQVPDFYFWQLITYGFLHGDMAHLFFNMFALWMFGVPLEQRWGSQRFSLYYFVCLVGAGLVQLAVAYLSGEVYPTVGASGAVFGLLLAFGMIYPNQKIMLLFIPVPIPAKWFVIGYGVIELLMGVGGIMPGVAHFAHLGGMAFGFALLWYWGWRPGRPGRV